MKRQIRIGDLVRLPHWKSCYYEVMGMNGDTLLGSIRDMKLGDKIVVACARFDVDEDWTRLLTVEEVLGRA